MSNKNFSFIFVLIFIFQSYFLILWSYVHPVEFLKKNWECLNKYLYWEIFFYLLLFYLFYV